MYVSLNFLPSFAEFYGEFRAPDPWATDADVLWSLEGYRLVSSTFSAGGLPNGRVPGQPVSKQTSGVFAGIRSTAYNRYRVLPLAVNDLWVENRIAPADLPWLLHEIEGKLRLSDYPPAMMRTYFRLTSVLFGVLAVVAVAVYLYFHFAGMIDDSSFIWLPVIVVVPAIVMFIGLLIVNARRKTIRERALEVLARRAGAARSAAAGVN